MNYQSTWQYPAYPQPTLWSQAKNKLTALSSTHPVLVNNNSVTHNLAKSSVNNDNIEEMPGMVSELVYCDSSMIISHILLPLLRQSGLESRWLLWVTPNMKLSRSWLNNAGLPLEKIVQLNKFDSISTVDAMEKALASGNYSVVLGWLPSLTDEENHRLQMAAQKGHSLGFVMRPQKNDNKADPFSRQPNALQIHSFCYH